MKLKHQSVQLIKDYDLNELVEKVYNRPFAYQQQDNCRDRGITWVDIPDPINIQDEDMNDDIPRSLNTSKMGVKFSTWLNADPNELLENSKSSTRLFWCRNFYPDLQTVLDDLHAKGLIDAGKYLIEVDW